MECINDQPFLNFCSTVYIFCDWAAIDSDTGTRFSTGIRPHNIKNLVSLQQQLSSLSIDIKLINVLGHTVLEGNDTVDNLVNDVVHQLLRSEISAPAAFEVARDISLKL